LIGLLLFFDFSCFYSAIGCVYAETFNYIYSETISGSGMSFAFVIDFKAKGVDVEHVDLITKWSFKFFEDCVIDRDTLCLTGYLSQSHTVAGLRRLVSTNLNNWKIPKLKRYVKDWLYDISGDEYEARLGRPSPGRRKLQMEIEKMCEDLVNEAVEAALQEIAQREIISAKHQQNIKHFQDRVKMTTLRTVFDALMHNTRPAAENRYRCELLHFLDLKDAVHELRTEFPETSIYINELTWRTDTPEKIAACLKNRKRPWREGESESAIKHEEVLEQKLKSRVS
jgi:hypothetical protein